MRSSKNTTVSPAAFIILALIAGMLVFSWMKTRDISTPPETSCLSIQNGGEGITSRDVGGSARFFGTVANSCDKTIENVQLRVFVYTDKTKGELISNNRIFKIADKIDPNSSVKYDLKFDFASPKEDRYYYELEFDPKQ